MPEIPEVVVYIEALEKRILGQLLRDVRLASPFVLRTFDPPITSARDRRVTALRRIGKRIVFDLDPDLHIVLHLMIAGRLKWLARGARIPGKLGVAAFDFDNGSLILTEASSQKRASIHVLRSDALRSIDPGGIEPFEADLPAFRAALLRENHTLKRALTDPHLFSGIGNAWSDEILHRARLSPVQLTRQLDDDAIERLYEACKHVLREGIDKWRADAGEGFPEKVTAFRPDHAVHGRYGLPCPVCGTSVQRIRFAANEVNYCPRCQTGGKLLADRALSRLLKGDWPRSIEELEELRTPKPR